MDVVEDACPWGSVLVDLSNYPVLISQKEWLARQINGRNQSASELSRKYSLPPFKLRRWARRLKEGLQLFKSPGRPRCLDQISISEATIFFADNPNTTYRQLKKNVRAKGKETLRRRYPTASAVF